MTYDDAVKFCEDHECVECDVYLKDLDRRTKHEKENLHYPCCVNLVDTEDEQHDIFRDATKEEREIVDRYIKEHSVDTGVNFYDFVN